MSFSALTAGMACYIPTYLDHHHHRLAPRSSANCRRYTFTHRYGDESPSPPDRGPQSKGVPWKLTRRWLPVSLTGRGTQGACFWPSLPTACAWRERSCRRGIHTYTGSVVRVEAEDEGPNQWARSREPPARARSSRSAALDSGMASPPKCFLPVDRRATRRGNGAAGASCEAAKARHWRERRKRGGLRIPAWSSGTPVTGSSHAHPFSRPKTIGRGDEDPRMIRESSSTEEGS